MKTIKMKFDLRTGEAKIEAQGFKGTSCEAATKFLKETLGKVSDFQRKAEWYEETLQLNGTINSNLCG